MNTIPTPFVDKVIAANGDYADERELFLAAIADGMSESFAALLVEDFVTRRDREWAEQQAAEIAAENAWLVHAESAGFWEAEAERDFYGF